MRVEVANRLTMSKAFVSAPRHVESQDVYVWVWVFPLKDGTFKISTVEIPKDFVDGDTCFGEEDIQLVHVATVDSLDAVDGVVRRLGVDPELLDVPWANDFPL